MMNTNLVKTFVMATAFAGVAVRHGSARADLPTPRSEARPVVATETPSTVVDPIEQSRKIRANLEMWPDRVHRRLAEAEQRLKGIDLREIQGPVLLAQDFEEILSDLDEEAAAIQDAFGKITTDLTLYQEAVAQAPASFRAVGAAFEKKAADCDDPVLMEHYACRTRSACPARRGARRRHRWPLPPHRLGETADTSAGSAVAAAHCPALAA
jgi:hypothetical protein